MSGSAQLLVPTVGKLWAHQLAAVVQARPCRDFALFLEQGTGKTPTQTTILRELWTKSGRAMKTLILCPQIVIRNWDSEINKWSPMGKYVQPLVGSKRERIAILENSDRSIFITNFESLDMEGLFWETFGLTRRRLIPRGFEVLIVDEAHRLKNSTAKRTKIAIQLADTCTNRYILTGTPCPNSPMDLWALFRILDGGQTFEKNFYQFRAKYFQDRNLAKPSHVTWPDWQLIPGMERVFNTLMYKKAVRVLKDDCLDLPPLVTTIIEIGMSGEQAAHYKSMKDDYITFRNSVACTTDLAITKAMRLQQIASGFLKMDTGDVVEFKDTPRVKALADLLEDLGEEKVIIWAVWKENYRVLAQVLDALKLSYAFLTGEQNAREKEFAVDRFTKGDTQILIANPAAGGTGVNLIEAPVAIWFSRNFSLTDRLQAQARNYRGGSEMHTKVTQYDLVCADTIDTHVLGALNNKQNVAERILARGNDI